MTKVIIDLSFHFSKLSHKGIVFMLKWYSRNFNRVVEFQNAIVSAYITIPHYVATFAFVNYFHSLKLYSDCTRTQCYYYSQLRILIFRFRIRMNYTSTIDCLNASRAHFKISWIFQYPRTSTSSNYSFKAILTF